MFFFFAGKSAVESAYGPGFPGYAVVGVTLKEVQTLLVEAVEFHIEGL